MIKRDKVWSEIKQFSIPNNQNNNNILNKNITNNKSNNNSDNDIETQ